MHLLKIVVNITTCSMWGLPEFKNLYPKMYNPRPLKKMELLSYYKKFKKS